MQITLSGLTAANTKKNTFQLFFSVIYLQNHFGVKAFPRASLIQEGNQGQQAQLHPDFFWIFCLDYLLCTVSGF